MTPNAGVAKYAPLADKYEFAMDTILRTTPALLGLFSIVALCAHELSKIAKAQIKDSPMVSKSGSHLQRCHRGGTPRNMSTSDFFHVTTPPRQHRNSPPYLASYGKRARL